MKFTTRFALQSQEARLLEGTPYAADSERRTGFSPSMMPCSKGLTPRPHAGRYLCRLQRTRPIRVCAFQAELFPLHSPLLRESLLVSFPPLSYMLKFSGSSCFISDLNVKGVLGKPHKNVICSNENARGYKFSPRKANHQRHST